MVTLHNSRSRVARLPVLRGLVLQLHQWDSADIGHSLFTEQRYWFSRFGLIEYYHLFTITATLHCTGASRFHFHHQAFCKCKFGRLCGGSGRRSPWSVAQAGRGVKGLAVVEPGASTATLQNSATVFELECLSIFLNRLSGCPHFLISLSLVFVVV